MTEAERTARLIEIIRSSPMLMKALFLVRNLDLPDWRIVSGAVYQPVWNVITGRDLDYGIRDYDLCYFDPDLSWDAEDFFIKRAATSLPAPFNKLVEVRNRARVHLWFKDRFGEHYSPLTKTDEMLERFACPAFSVGVRLMPNGIIDVAAPFGLEDLFSMRLRPNPIRPINPDGLRRIMISCQSRWPEVVAEFTGGR